MSSEPLFAFSRKTLICVAKETMFLSNFPNQVSHDKVFLQLHDDYE